MKLRPISEEIYRESCTTMPGGVNSPVRAFTSLDMTPLIVASGQGATIWDLDGHAYIDYCGAWGSLILGHCPPAVIQAASDQMNKGTSFGISTPYEHALARKILDHIPSIEKLRFVSSGTEATMSAIRLARGYTGRPLIVKFNGHYHGHSDSLLLSAGSGVSHLPEASSEGVPHSLVQHTVSLPFNATDLCRTFLRSRSDIAGVLVEPIAGNMGVVPAKREFLQMLKEETASSGALLIFDEVITGYRVGLHGAQAMYGISPDLTCLAKIIGGGFPAAAFGGKKEIMDRLSPLGAVYQAGTLSGNPVAMAAGLKTLELLEAPGFYEAIELKTRLLTDPIEEWIRSHSGPVCLNRIGSMFTLFFGMKKVESKEDLVQLDHTTFKAFFQFLFREGIYISPSPYEACFVSAAHSSEHLITTREKILWFLEEHFS